MGFCAIALPDLRGRNRYVPRHAQRRRSMVGAMIHGSTARNMVAASALAAVALVGTQLQAPPPGRAAQQDILRVSQEKRLQDTQRLLDGINAYRGSRGLRSVKFSAQLTQIEQRHSDEQVIAETFYHTNDFLSDRRAGRYSHANEVIALTYQTDVLQLLEWWKTSPAHSAALLNPKARVVGIALTYADGYLSRTGAPWRLLGTVNLYGYEYGGAPSDASDSVWGSRAAGERLGALTPYGAIGQAYRANGGEGVFGRPIIPESNATGGRYQIFQDEHGQRFKFLWTERTGAHWVKEYGAIGTLWSRSDYERGFGFPVTNEYRRGNEIRQHFSRGYILGWNVHTGALRIYH